MGSEIYAWLGALGVGSVLGGAVIWSVRRLLQHAVAVWGVCVEVEGHSEYRFTIQNLEAVPIDRKIWIRLREENCESWAAPNGASEGGGAEHIRHKIRIYSGANVPWFERWRAVSEMNGCLETFVSFGAMEPFGNWSISLVSSAKQVSMLIGTGVGPGSEARFRFKRVGLDLAVRKVEVSEGGAIRAGPKVMPTPEGGLGIAVVAPAIYLYWEWVESLFGLHLELFSWTFDPAIASALLLVGIGWYFFVKRPVVPIIRAYRMFWTPGDRGLATDADCVIPALCKRND